MTAIVEQQALATALGRVRGAVEARRTIPILANLLIVATREAEGESLSLIGTDLDIEMAAVAEATVEAAFRCTAQADLLVDIVKRVPKGAQIRLILEEDGDLRLRWGRNSASLKTLPAEDFPRLLVTPVGPDAPVMIAMPLETLSGALAFCVPAISSEETRYYLNGVYLHPAPEGASGDPGTLRAVATDGHRLARADTALPWPQGWPEKGGILPRKPVGMLTDADGDAQIGLTERLLRIETEGWALTAKMIDGTFPDYSRVIPVPEPSAQRFTLDRGALAEAVQIGLVPSRADRKTAAIRMTPEDGGITLSAHSPDHGSATIPLDGTVSPGADGVGWPVGFNGRYLADLLTVLNNGEVTFTQNGSAGEPALITQPESARALVLMPMRV